MSTGFTLPEARPVIEWQRTERDGSITLCDPFYGQTRKLDPRSAPIVVGGDAMAAMGIDWLSHVDMRQGRAKTLGMVMVYSMQDTYMSGGRFSALETIVRGTAALGEPVRGVTQQSGADAYLYSIASGESVRPNEPQRIGSFEQRVGQLISHKDAPSSAQVGLQAENVEFGGLDGALMQMSERLAEVDPDDPLAVIGNLVYNHFDNWNTAACIGRELMVMSSGVQEDQWKVEPGAPNPGLRVAFSGHVNNVGLTYAMDTFPGVVIGSSDLIPDPNIPEYVLDGTLMEISKRCAIPAEFM